MEFARKHIIALIIIFIVSLAIFLRLTHLGTFPVRNESSDEIAWTMYGASLLETGTPQAWSYFPYEQKEHATIQGYYYPLVKPYLDHPPLFSFIPGVVQYLSGVTWREPIDLTTLRLPMVFLATINMLLLYVVAKLFFEKPRYIFVTLLLYAVIPSVVFANRLIISEQLVITEVLLLLWLMLSKHSWLTPQRKMISLAILAVTVVLTKVSAVAFLAVAFFWYWKSGKTKLALTLIVSGILGLLLWLLFAAQYDLLLLLNIQFSQGAWRHTGLLTPIIQLITKPEVVNSFFMDGFFLLSLIGISIGLADRELFKNKSWQLLFCMIGGYLLFLLLTVGEIISDPAGTSYGSSLYGWYIYPLYPLFTLTIGHLFEKMEDKNIGLIILFALLGLFPVLRQAYILLNPPPSLPYSLPKLVVILAAAVLLLPFFKPKLAPKLYLSIFVVCSVITCLLMNYGHALFDTEYLMSL